MKKLDNKGFSLVELIIVIAIMAILIGVVGTQVIPYLNRSREAKDLQILSSYGTAAVSAYSMNAEKITANLTVSIYDTTVTDASKKLIQDTVKELTYATLPTNWSSTAGTSIASIEVAYDFSTNTVTVTAKDSSGAQVLQPVESLL